MATVPTEKTSLFERLGGKTGVARIVDDFLDKFLAHENVRNPRVIRRHDTAHHPELRKQWIALVSELVGGPRQYVGRTMRSAHAGYEISNDDFDATIALMEQTLTRLGVAETEHGELLHVMRAQRKAVVEAHTGSSQAV